MDPEPNPKDTSQQAALTKKKSSKKSVLQPILLQSFLSQLPSYPNMSPQKSPKQFLTTYIKPITYKNKDQFEAMFQSTVTKIYEPLIQKIVQKIISDMCTLITGCKQLQVVQPILDIIVNVYTGLLLNTVKQGHIQKKDVLERLWQIVPARNMADFLGLLGLEKDYQSIPVDKMTKWLISLINDNKLQNSCSYYRLYGQIAEFQQQILIPKLVTTDQIHTPPIVQLLQSRPSLKQKLIPQLDSAKAIVMMEHLNEDPRVYEHINRFILRKHYKSMLYQYGEWYIFEDKMSFNSEFIMWYCQEKQQQLGQDIVQSIKFRNGLPTVLKAQLTPNPLYKADSFTFAEQIVPSLQHNKTPQKYISFKDYKIAEESIHFIDSTESQEYKNMVQVLHKQKYIGFDAEYRCTSTKYEQAGVAVVQLATQMAAYVIDFILLQKDKQFRQFFTWLLKDPEHVIVGHSVQGDIKYIERTMKIEGLQGYIDISKQFKQKYKNETQNSLFFMTTYLLNRHLSKYEQRSNWNRRPLKKTQLHYAALDAYICLKLYEIMKRDEGVERLPQEGEGKVPNGEVLKKKSVQNIVNYVRKDNIVYREDLEFMLTEDRPKFLVDSMLKRLCSLLRNLGIDAQYVAVSNYQLMQETAKSQKRILLTRDRKLLNKKSPAMPIYIISQKGDSDYMLQQVIKQFKINLSLYTPLSRCVKCNCSDLEVIDRVEAMKFIHFQYEDNKISEFWRCTKCKQIYWEGNQFKNAKKKFDGIGAAKANGQHNGNSENPDQDIQKKEQFQEKQQKEVKQEQSNKKQAQSEG